MSRYSRNDFAEFGQVVLHSDQMQIPSDTVISCDESGAWILGWFRVSDESIRRYKLAKLEASGTTNPPLEEV